jgi:aminomethyltransferase
MKRTPLYDLHLSLGAKMVPFAGFEMPIQFEGIVREHQWVREYAGLFDVSHMGEIEISGDRALEFVNYITSNDASKLEEFGVQYTLLLNDGGGIVDDTLLYRLEDRFLFVVNAANIDKDYRWIKEKVFDGVEVRNLSDSYAELALQGPKAQQVLSELYSGDLNEIAYYMAARGMIAGVDCLISRTGYTGEDGFEIYLEPERAVEVAEMILQNPLVKPVGLGARDTLRLEMGYCLYGNDIDEHTTPLEARLAWTAKFEKGDFIGKDALLKLKEKGIEKVRVGFVGEKRGVIPRPHLKLFKEGEVIGEVTSGTHSPSLGVGIGMGYVKVDYRNKDTHLEIEVRGRRADLRVVSLPFYKEGSIKRVG